MSSLSNTQNLCHVWVILRAFDNMFVGGGDDQSFDGDPDVMQGDNMYADEPA